MPASENLHRNGHLAAPSLRPPPNEASRRSCGVTAVASLDQLLYHALPQNREGKQVATIAEWLASLGMSEYAQRFAENDIETSVLRHLTDQDLKELASQSGIGARCWQQSSSLRPRRRQPRSTPSGGTTLSTAKLRSCSVTSSARRRSRPGSTQRICRRSSVPITDVAPKSSPNPMVSSRDTWATVCSPISAIRRPMKTMPSRQCARGWRWSKRWRSSISAKRCRCTCGSVLPPA